MEINHDLFIFDEPYPYKDLKIHPILMKDFGVFNSCISCLLLPKNYEPDIAIIKMSYLEYLFYMIIKSQEENNDQTLISMLYYMMNNLILKDQEFILSTNEQGVPIFIVNGVQYDSFDFDNLKEIIFIQNEVEREDENMSFEVIKALREAKQKKMELESNSQGNLEEIVTSMMIYTGWDSCKIKNMTKRKFFMCIERIEILESYKICTTAEMSGMVTFKDKVSHWLSHYKRQGVYDDIKMDKDAFSNKFKDTIGMA